eukprot:jgi/Botrbrau1/19269/Bobra.0073s0018.1
MQHTMFLQNRSFYERSTLRVAHSDLLAFHPSFLHTEKSCSKDGSCLLVTQHVKQQLCAATKPPIYVQELLHIQLMFGQAIGVLFEIATKDLRKHLGFQVLILPARNRCRCLEPSLESLRPHCRHLGFCYVITYSSCSLDCMVLILGSCFVIIYSSCSIILLFMAETARIWKVCL